MNHLFDNVQTISDIVCTNGVKYCESATSCNDKIFSQDRSTHVKESNTKNELRKNLEHSIEMLIGSTMDQAFQTVHNICSLTTTSEHTFFDKSKGSTLSSKRSQSGNKNIRSSSATKLPDTKSSDKKLDRISNNYILEILIDDPDEKEFCLDPISPISQFSAHFENPNKPLQFSSYQENDSLTLSTIFSEEKENQNRFNYASNYDSYDDSIIREITNETFTLTHHTYSTEERMSTSATCVKFWFEMGPSIKNKLTQPKLVWRERHPNNREMCPQPCFFSCQDFNSIDLLSISRVLKGDHIHSKKFPFAKLKNSFTLQCVDEHDVYLFEAQSEEECDKLIYGLKCIIAKIASMTIVGDDNVYDVFLSLHKRATNLVSV